MLTVFRRLFAVSLLLIFAGLACTSSTMDILSPKNTSVHATVPTEFSVQFLSPFAEDAEFIATLNGQDISSWFTIAADGLTASADGNNFLSAYVEGENVFDITSPFPRTSKFLHDVEGPLIHIVSTTDTGSDLQIDGYLQDRAGVSALEVNGAAIDLTNNLFIANTPDTPILHFNGTDSFGSQRSTYYARPATEMTNSVSFQLTDSALAQFGSVVSDLINVAGAGLLDSIGLGGNALIFSSGGGPDSFNVYVTSLTIGTTTIDMTVDQVNLDGTLDLDSGIQDIVFGIDVEVTVSGFPAGTLPGTISTTLLSFTGDVTPALSVDGLSAEMPLSNLVIDLGDGFTHDVPGLPPEYVPLFDTLADQLGETMGTEIITQTLPPLMGAAMTPLIDFPIDLQSASVNVMTQTESFSVVGDSLDVVMSSTFESTALIPELNPALGSIYSPAPMASVPDQTPGGLPYDLGLVLSTKMLNQLLLTSYESGLFGLSADSVIDFSGFDLGGLITGMEIATEDNLRVIVTSISPPFIKLDTTSSSLGEIQVYDMQLEMFIKLGDGTEFLPVFKGDINFFAPFNMSASVDGSLELGLDGSPTVSIATSEFNGGFVWGADLIEDLINVAIAEIMPDVFSSVASFPLPAIDGLGLLVQDIWVADDNEHVAIGANMLLGGLPVAPAPSTFVMGGSGDVMMEATEPTPQGPASITVMVGATGATDTEYRYRLNDSAWTIWKPRTSITIDNLITGAHQVEVCARNKYLVEDPSCPVYKFSVDQYGRVIQ